MKENLLAKWREFYDYYSISGSVRIHSEQYFYNIELYEHLKTLMRLGIKPSSKEMEQNIIHFEKKAKALSSSRARSIGNDEVDLMFMFEKLDEVIFSSSIGVADEKVRNPYYTLCVSAILVTDCFTEEEIRVYEECFKARYYAASSGITFFALQCHATNPPTSHQMNIIESMCMRSIKAAFSNYMVKQGKEPVFEPTWLDRLKDYFILRWI